MTTEERQSREKMQAEEERQAAEEVKNEFATLDEIALRLSYKLVFKDKTFSCAALAFCLMKAGDRLAAQGKDPGELWKLMERPELQDELNAYLRENPDIWAFSEYLIHVKRSRPRWFTEMQERKWTDWLSMMCEQKPPADLF